MYKPHRQMKGIISEYLVFGDNHITWWFDGRDDAYSEFQNPSIRKMQVVKLFLAVHDGESAFKPLKREGDMPLDSGLAIGIQLKNGETRYW
jgi:hypothetical protein